MLRFPFHLVSQKKHFLCSFIPPLCLGVRVNPNHINDGGDNLNTKDTLKSLCFSKVLFLFLAARLAVTFGLRKMVIHAVSAPPLYSIKVTDCHCMFIGYWCIFQTCAVSVHHMFHTHIYIYGLTGPGNNLWPRRPAQITSSQRWPAFTFVGAA